MNECPGCAPEGNITRPLSTRRRFLVAMIGIASTVLGVILGLPFVSSLVSPRFRQGKETWSKVGDLQSVPIGEPVRLNFAQTEQDAFIQHSVVDSVWVIRKSAAEAIAYSPICPHAGCYYNWNARLRQFICPCHASVFTIDGAVVSGPAPRALDTLPAKIENNNLYITWRRFRVGVSEKIVS